MRKRLITTATILLISLLIVTPVAAIDGGQPDGEGHPYGGLLLVPGFTFCSGTLIGENAVLTAGHCTYFWSDPANEITEVWVTFDSKAAVDPETWQPTDGTWYLAHEWYTHPDYVDADWPFTADYGLVILDEPVQTITPAVLPEPGLVDALIGTTGQTGQRFSDVGYGQSGVYVGGGTPTRKFEFTRKVSIQRYNPSKGSVGTQDPRWLVLVANPSENHGGGCGGDSGSGIFPYTSSGLRNTLVAVHTGGYRLGYEGVLCGRITSLNHRVDLPLVLNWLAGLLRR
jgi:hypothetical protein